MKVIIMILGVIIFILFITIIVCSVKSSKRKALLAFIKVEDGQKSINNFLKNKKKLLKDSKKLINDDEYLSDFSNIKFSELDDFRVNEILNEYYLKFKDKLYEDEDIAKEEKIVKLIDKLREVDYNLKASIKFYDHGVEEYHNVFNHFPAKVVKLFCGFKKLESFDEKKTNTEKLY